MCCCGRETVLDRTSPTRTRLVIKDEFLAANRRHNDIVGLADDHLLNVLLAALLNHGAESRFRHYYRLPAVVRR